MDTSFDLPYIALTLSVFAGAAISSFAGFAFSPVAAIGLIYFIPHDRLIPLLMLCSILVQLITLLYFRRSITWTSVGPMVFGGALGVTLAVFLFQGLDAQTFQIGFGAFLVLYAAAMLWRPTNRLAGSTTPAREAAVGFVGGVVGGLTAMPGAIPIIYSDLRGVSKEVQRSTVQSFILAMQVLAVALFAGNGAIDWAVTRDLVLTLPALGAGIIVGLTLFGRVPDARFRQAILAMLLITGVAMVRPTIPAHAMPLASEAQTSGLNQLVSECKRLFRHYYDCDCTTGFLERHVGSENSQILLHLWAAGASGIQNQSNTAADLYRRHGREILDRAATSFAKLGPSLQMQCPASHVGPVRLKTLHLNYN